MNALGRPDMLKAQPVRDNRGAGQRKAEADPFKREEAHASMVLGPERRIYRVPLRVLGQMLSPDGGERWGQRFYRGGAHGGVYGGESVTK